MTDSRFKSSRLDCYDYLAHLHWCCLLVFARTRPLRNRPHPRHPSDHGHRRGRLPAHRARGCAPRAGIRSPWPRPETYRAQVHTLCIELCSLVTVAEVDRMLADPDLWHPFRSGKMMARWGASMIPRHYEALTALAGQPDSVLVANPGSSWPPAWSRRSRGVPTASPCSFSPASCRAAPSM